MILILILLDIMCFLNFLHHSVRICMILYGSIVPEIKINETKYSKKLSVTPHSVKSTQFVLVRWAPIKTSPLTTAAMTAPHASRSLVLGRAQPVDTSPLQTLHKQPRLARTRDSQQNCGTGRWSTAYTGRDRWGCLRRDCAISMPTAQQPGCGNATSAAPVQGRLNIKSG